MEFSTPLLVSILFSSFAFWTISRSLKSQANDQSLEDFSDHLLS